MKLLIQQQLLQLLQLLLLLQYSCARDFHKDLYISGCSDSDGESMVGLDGDVMYYADFDKKEVVYTLPQFGDPMECPGFYEQSVSYQGVCKRSLEAAREALKDIPLEIDPPGAPLLYPRDHLKPSHHNTLVCQASGFYPAPVRFYWTKDGQNVSLSASVSQSYPQSDWTYTQFSRLDITPEEGQVYSCALDHPGLKGETRSRIWTVEFQKPSLAPSVFCAVGLTLGLVGVAVGTFFLVKGRECC